MRMSLEDISLLAGAERQAHEVVEATRPGAKFNVIAGRKAAANLSSRAKWLLNAIRDFRKAAEEAAASERA